MKKSRYTDAQIINMLKALETESPRLKRMYVDLQLQNDVIREAMDQIIEGGAPQINQVCQWL